MAKDKRGGMCKTQVIMAILLLYGHGFIPVVTLTCLQLPYVCNVIMQAALLYVYNAIKPSIVNGLELAYMYNIAGTDRMCLATVVAVTLASVYSIST